ncbi:hypothetical protein P154DRAFT_485419 [Amniculicola lignicola CBS 123094]|uniref:Rhodopsin domain-containing protein n=1 Tax=Amniculicola lignicola CBS 123094 TaxID=1392246 RepID=A0A6A5WYW1_9PLEO|nr:hypothetical protein P154DRAFT_485419 [Amniculicola lignicola CBS 123094]
MDPTILAALSPAEIAALWEGPALEPPLGVMPDFDHPGGTHSLGYAVGLYAGFLYCCYDLAMNPGFRVHQWNIPLKQLPHLLYNSHIGSICYGLVIMLLKAAILLSWLRIFVPMGQRNAMFWISHGLIWSNVLFYGIGTAVEIFQCTPREKIWNPLYVGGSCVIEMPMHMRASGVINLISDVIILALPQRVIWSLHISNSRKVGLSFLFAIGAFACISAAVRLVYLLKMLASPDQLYTGSELLFWMIAELTAGFLIMGFPSLPKVVQSLPFTESVVSLIRMLTSAGSRDGTPGGSRQGLPSWYRRPSTRRARQTDGSDFDQHDLVFLHSTNASKEHADQDKIVREVTVSVENRSLETPSISV